MNNKDGSSGERHNNCLFEDICDDENCGRCLTFIPLDFSFDFDNDEDEDEEKEYYWTEMSYNRYKDGNRWDFDFTEDEVDIDEKNPILDYIEV